MNGKQEDKILTDARVRNLTIDDLGIILPTSGAEDSEEMLGEHPSLESAFGPDDPFVQEADELLQRYAGIIYTGPPGTSKSFVARNVALRLVDLDPKRVLFVQFHPSYQYEDFVEGFVPARDGKGFVLVEKHLLEMCSAARAKPDQSHVIVIDEISRADPARVFGEALTYVELPYRDLEFKLASGTTVDIPSNLRFLATMNPLDRGVVEVDSAFERRFAKVDMQPDARILEEMLAANRMEAGLRSRVITFFNYVNGERVSEYAKLGHAFFRETRTLRDLEALWDHQLSFHFKRAYQVDLQEHERIVSAWNQVVNTTPEGTSEQSSDSA